MSRESGHTFAAFAIMAGGQYAVWHTGGYGGFDASIAISVVALVVYFAGWRT